MTRRSHAVSFRTRGVRSNIDVVTDALLRVFDANPIRTGQELHEALHRRGHVVGYRSIRSALARLRAQGQVTVEHLNARCVIYTWVGVDSAAPVGYTGSVDPVGARSGSGELSDAAPTGSPRLGRS